MLTKNRVIWEDNVTLVDISKQVNDIFANPVTFNFVTGDDYLYIGNPYPFNHLFFDVTTANDVSSTASVSVWDSSAWVSAVDVIDETIVSGASLAQSGIIRWSTDRNQSWGLEETTEDISALSTLKIYNLHWIRVSWSATLKVTTAINYIGHKFATDTQLEGYYPDLVRSDLISAFKSGKTNWKEQHVLAAEEIIKDLQQKKFVLDGSQIFTPELFNLAAIYKIAEILFRSFGDDYKDQKEDAAKLYKEALMAVQLDFDKNKDGHLEIRERNYNTGLRRR